MPRSSLSPPGGPSEAIWPGEPWPLGATWDGGGVAFAVFSENATRIDLCLYDGGRGPETARLRLPETTAHVFHGYVPGLAPGQLYGYFEGETDDEVVNNFRERQVRNFLATLMVSQGVPMLVAGDEMGRTQRGNNNAYCQDNDLSWIDWALDDRKRHLLDFTRRLIEFRKHHPVLRRRRFFRGTRILGSLEKDLAWFRPDGVEMKQADWDEPTRRVAFILGGDAIPSPDPWGRRVVDDTLLIVMNGEREDETFVLPARRWAEAWERVLDTEPDERLSRVSHTRIPAGASVELGPLSMAVFVGVGKDDVDSTG
ncbi:MAG: hypothetical protein HYV09_20420 [Deltaproteobacteria bacterium]|nr:hypothetical protein [Deltaproteobacteria bacterium]